MPKGRPVVWKGNPLKEKPQERYWREIKPEGSREEEGVRRLRKPEDAAQSGEANPVYVASRYLMRCRGKKPQESKLRKRRFHPGQTLKQGQVHGRIWALGN
jgi:hypothetical protein